MREFIESIVGISQLDFRYGEYDLLFVKHNYDSYYLFFFLKDKENLLVLKNEAGNIIRAIKEDKKMYQPNMDKNITCIFCLCVGENEYYEVEENGKISELSKIICLTEEDLNYFKKNVFLYTVKMEEFARKNIGRFEELCQKYFTEDNFQLYKKSYKNIWEYDFLINLFIKIPFLSFYRYQYENGKTYNTINAFIEKMCKIKEIDCDNADVICEQLEEIIEDEDMLYEWLDALIESDKNDTMIEVIEDED